MSRVPLNASASLEGFLLSWEDVNAQLVQLSRASFLQHPFALFQASSEDAERRAACGSLGSDEDPAEEVGASDAAASPSVTAAYSKVYQLLSGVGPICGNKDVRPKVFRSDASPISPYADGDSSSSSTNSTDDDEEGAGSVNANRAPNSSQRRRKRKSRADRCIYDRAELLLHLSHVAEWLWVAVMSKASGDRLRLPHDVAHVIRILQSQNVTDSALRQEAIERCSSQQIRESSAPSNAGALDNPFLFELDSERDAQLWWRTLHRMRVAWLGEDGTPRSVRFLPPSSSRRVSETEDTENHDEFMRGLPDFHSGRSSPSSCFFSVEHLVSLHALVTTAQHFQSFSRVIRTVFLRLSLALTERLAGRRPCRRPRGHRGGDSCQGLWDFCDQVRRNEPGPNAPSGGTPSSDTTQEGLAQSRPWQADNGRAHTSVVGMGTGSHDTHMVDLLLHRALRVVLTTNSRWVRGVIACAASATVGREDMETPSILTSAPSSPLTPVPSVTAARRKIQEQHKRRVQQRREMEQIHQRQQLHDGTDGAAFSFDAAEVPSLDWWEVARYIEEFDVKHIFLVHAMVETSRAFALQEWTLSVVEQTCFTRGRRLLNSALSSAIPFTSNISAAAAVAASVTGVPRGDAAARDTVGSAVNAMAVDMLQEAAAMEITRSEGAVNVSGGLTSSGPSPTPPPPLSSSSHVHPVPSAQLAKASQALREVLRAYMRLRAALMLFNAGTTHYMDALTACGKQRVIAGMRAFANGFCSRQILPGPAPQRTPAGNAASSDSFPDAAHGESATALTTGNMPPVVCDVQQFMTLYGVPLWLLLCEETKRRQAERSAKAALKTKGARKSSLTDLGENEDDGLAPVSAHPLSTADLRGAGLRGPSDRDRVGDDMLEDGEDGLQTTMTPPSSHAPTEAPPAASAPVVMHSVGGGSGVHGAAAASTTVDGQSFHDARSEATSTKAAHERQNWLRRALGTDVEDEAEERRELQFMASLPEDGLPTLLYLLTRDEADRRRILNAFSDQVHRYLGLLLEHSGGGSGGREGHSHAARLLSPAGTEAPPVGPTRKEHALQPLPTVVFEKCVFALHMTQNAFARQDLSPDTTQTATPAAPVDPAVAALAETATAAVCRGLQVFFAEHEHRVSLTLAHALHAQCLEASRAEAPRTAATMVTTLQVVDTLLALASLLPTRELFVKQYKALMAPALLTHTQTATDLDVDAEVLSRMALRLGAVAVHPCMTLLYDLRAAMRSTRGVEPAYLREGPVADGQGSQSHRRGRTDKATYERADEDEDFGNERKRDGTVSRNQRSIHHHGVTSPGSERPVGDLEGPGRSHVLLPTSGARRGSPTASSGPASLGALLMSSPLAGPSRSPMAYAMSLLSGNNSEGTSHGRDHHHRNPTADAINDHSVGTVPSLQDPRASQALSLKRSLPSAPPALVRHLRVLCEAWWAPHTGPFVSAHAMRRLFERRQFFTESFIDAVLRTEWYYCDPQQRQQQQQQQPALEAARSSTSPVLLKPFPGYGRYNTNALHGRMASYDSAFTDELGNSVVSGGGGGGGGGGDRSPSLFSLSQASHSIFGISTVLRRTEHRSGAFGNDDPEDEDEDFMAAYGGVLTPSVRDAQRMGRGGRAGGGGGRGSPQHRRQTTMASIDEVGSVSSYDAAAVMSEAGGAAGSVDESLYGIDDSSSHGRLTSANGDFGAGIGGGGAAPLHGSLERRRLRWPIASGQLVFLVHPCGASGRSAEAPFQVSGPPVCLLLLQTLDRARRDSEGKPMGLTLHALCQAMPVPTPKPIVAAILKSFLAAGLLQRRVDAQARQHLYFIPDSFETPTTGASRSGERRRGKKGKMLHKRKVTVDLTSVLQNIPLLALMTEDQTAAGASAEATTGDGATQPRGGVDSEASGGSDTEEGTAGSPTVERARGATAREKATSQDAQEPLHMGATKVPGSSSLLPSAAAGAAGRGGTPLSLSPGAEALPGMPAPPASPAAEKHLQQVAEAIIVRVLKKEGTVTHATLAGRVEEWMGSSRFTTVLFKNAVARLLERDFIRRKEEERAYAYVP